MGGCRRPVAVSSEEFRDAFPSPDSSSASDSAVDAVPASTASDAPAPAVVSQSLHNQPGNGASVGNQRSRLNQDYQEIDVNNTDEETAAFMNGRSPTQSTQAPTQPLIVAYCCEERSSVETSPFDGSTSSVART